MEADHLRIEAVQLVLQLACLIQKGEQLFEKRADLQQDREDNLPALFLCLVKLAELLVEEVQRLLLV